MDATDDERDPMRTEPPQTGNHSTLESVLGAVTGADPQQFYQDGQRFEITAQRLHTLNDGFRRELHRLEEAWQSPGARRFFEAARRITDTVDHLVETLTTPSYSALHVQLGDAVSEVTRQLSEVQRQREEGRRSLANDPARNGNPQEHQELQQQERMQDAHAGQLLEQLATAYRQIGGQLKPFPARSTSGNPVRAATHRSSAWIGDGTGSGGAGSGVVMVTTAGYSTLGFHGDSGTGPRGRTGFLHSGGTFGYGTSSGYDSNGGADSNGDGDPDQHATNAPGRTPDNAGAARGAMLAGSGVLGRGDGGSHTAKNNTASSNKPENSLTATGVPGVLSAVALSGGASGRGRNRDRDGRGERQSDLVEQADARSQAGAPSTVSTPPAGQTATPTADDAHSTRPASSGTAPGAARDLPAAPPTSTDSPPPRSQAPASPPRAVATGASPTNGVPTGVGGMSVSHAPAPSPPPPGQLADTTSPPTPPAPEATARPSAPVTGPSTAAATAQDGSPMGGVPPAGGMGAGGQNDRERDRNTFRHENDDVWNETGFSGGVLGR